MELRVADLLHLDGCAASTHLRRLLLANIKRLVALLLFLRSNRATRLIIVLETHAVVGGTLRFILALVFEALLGRILRSWAQVYLQILNNIRLAIFEVMGDVTAHHAHLAMTLTVGTGLTLIWHNGCISPYLGTHGLVIPL